MKRIFLTLGLIGFTALAFADVPVVDYSSQADSSTMQASESSADSATTAAETPASHATAPKQNLSMEQRVNKLEGQVDNLNQQNTAAKIDDLQQRIQTISGKLDEQTHQIEQLNSQSKNFYQDLNQRLDKSKASTDKPAEVADNNGVSTKASAPSSIKTAAGAPKKSTADNDTALLKEQQLYQTAIDLLPDKKYDESSKKLHAYLAKYPKGGYAANAHYWLGEVAFLQKNYAQAETEFKVVADKYPDSKKIADASLKIALVHDTQGKHDQARAELKQVMQKYPNTTAAQLAKQQLETN